MKHRWLPPFRGLTDPAPHARLLSNGRYTTLLTSAGTGYSTWGETLLTAWDGDRVEDAAGWFVYLRDLDRERLWSAGYQPVPDAGGRCTARYQPGRVTLQRRVDGIESELAVCVAPDADVEVRRLTLTNHSQRQRRIEVTSYLEVVLNNPAAHAAHPAFSKLFVQTELMQSTETLLARRRARSHEEAPPWMAAQCLGDGELQCETDRARFLGRNRALTAPRAVTAADPLSGSVGSVLDPVVAMRRSVVLAPQQSAQLHLLLAGGADRDQVLGALGRCRAPEALSSVFDRAATQARAAMKALRIDAATAEAYQELAGAVLYGHPALRCDAATIERAQGALAQIWQYALGGAPVMAIRAGAGDSARVAELLTARAYWGQMGVRVDLAVLCDDGLDPAAVPALGPPQPAGTVFVRREKDLPPGDVDVLLAASAVFGVRELAPALGWEGSEGSDHAQPHPPQSGSKLPHSKRESRRAKRNAAAPAAEPLRFDNGVGGFSADGSEYVIRLDGARRPPLAWTNVVANERFGFLASESGAAFSWSRNSHEYRLTPWQNDALGDPHGEALYLRDDDSAAVWSPQPGPAPGGAPYEVRHGFGYSTWRHTSHELEQEVVAFVPVKDAVRIARLRVTNRGTTARRISLVSYQRLVLGSTSRESARFVVSRHDAAPGLLRAHNRIAGDFADADAFATAVIEDGAARISWTADRASFIGRNGNAAAPAALGRGGGLDGRSGAGLDPCFALQISCEIAAGATVDCAFLLGEAAGAEACAALVRRYRRLAAIDAALAEARAFWRDTHAAVQVETPAPAIDLMVNGWLVYQVLSCRLWGRSALYQSGGAFGFRDQLQDAAALLYAHPALTRAQLLLHAAHQFVEGDVLHWWHAPAGRGTRTRFSDDLLWLPYVACLYAGTTGDWKVFDEVAPFLSAPVLAAGQDENYLLPARATETADLYGHCCRAIDRSLTRGAHGLPLMGTGDWNDGMNRVGREGRGESVWLGFFLFDLLADFIALCERRGDGERAGRYGAYRTALGASLNEGGWDGAWYRRAYYDDGTPLGSAQNSECRIDAIAQAWALISGAAPPERVASVLAAVDEHLVDRAAGLIRLLAPPFDRDAHDPGYIKGYVPGIRENGGQYTHGAMWVVRALAEAGRRQQAAAYLEMLSPVSHTSSADRLAVYQVEPYVVVADIYGVAPHLGRGGWTWYTGSAGWMYRVALESVLGVRIEEGKSLVVAPCIPDEWPGFRVRLRLGDGRTQYEVAVENPQRTAGTVVAATADGQPARVVSGAAEVALIQDGGSHHVRVVLGAAPTA